MKSLTVKQAERWFDKLKTNNPNSFKEILKHLRKFEKTNDQYDCFTKINTILLEHPELTKEMNNYLQDPNKLVVNRNQVERINELVKYVKKVKPQAFEEIVNMIKDLSHKRSANSIMSQEEQNRLLKDFVLEKVKGSVELQNYAQKALNYSAEESIKKLDLTHLVKPTKASTAQAARNDQSMEVSHYQPQARNEEPLMEEVRPKIRVYPPFININEEKMFIRNLEAYLSPQTFEILIKIMEIYRHGIITKFEALQFVKPYVGAEYEGIKDILETRETDRRKYCPFRPLNDTDFSNFQRATHSYVNMPASYPHICSNNSALAQQTLNRTWVSVPKGSQEFNLRIRNTFEQNLIRAEDDRYELDLNLNRMRKCLTIQEQIIKKLDIDPNADVTNLIKKIINMGIIQILYKNLTKQQKDEFQYYTKKSPYETCNIFKDRIKSQMIDLTETRSIHGMKIWNEIAQKNSVKALDFKGHQFKRTEKMKMKKDVFLQELRMKLNYLEKRGASKDLDTPFQEKKQFFSVFNSFETTSRKEKCLSRKTPNPMVFNIDKYNIPNLLPAMILAFEDERAIKLAFSLTDYYIDNGTNETEKARSNLVLRSVMSQFFGRYRIQSRKINQETFNEEQFFSKIFRQNTLQSNSEQKTWILIEGQTEDFKIHFEENEQPKLKVINDTPSEYGFLPLKTDKNLVFFASQSFYVFLRYLYALYERIIRLYEISKESNTATLFQVLYYHMIKSKQNSKFEECLNSLFGENAYIFTTFYKLIESLVKSITGIANCPLTNYSLKLAATTNSEDIYLLLLNKYCLINSISSPKILRFVFEKDLTQLLYINCLQSFYRNPQQNKQLLKRRTDINSKVETYTILKDFIQYEDQPNVSISSKMQYHFQGNTIKLINIAKGQDVIVSKSYKSENKREKIMQKRLRKEMEKIKMVYDHIN